jgi:hypothetical protein
MKWISICFLCLVFIFQSPAEAKKKRSSKRNSRRDGLIIGLGISAGQHVPYAGDFSRHGGMFPSSRIGWAFGPTFSITSESMGVMKISDNISTVEGVETSTVHVRAAGGGMFSVRLYPFNFFFIEAGGGSVSVVEEKRVNDSLVYKKEATGVVWSSAIGIEFFVAKDFDIAMSLGFKYMAYNTNKATIVTDTAPLENDISKPHGRIAMGFALWSWYF